MSSSTLFHLAFHPPSRLARLALGEAKLEVEETPVRPWEADCPVAGLNPSGLPPVLQVAEGRRTLTLCEPAAILGWLEDHADAPFLLPKDAADRAETRRLLSWFEHRFTNEVDAVLLHERVEKPLLRLGPPDARALRHGRGALKTHLELMENLLARHEWLVGRRLTAADLAAAGHLSVLDYFGEVPWRSHPALKVWWMKLKSRPSFRPILADRFPGVAPAAHYDDLDF